MHILSTFPVQRPTHWPLYVYSGRCPIDITEASIPLVCIVKHYPKTLNASPNKKRAFIRPLPYPSTLHVQIPLWTIMTSLPFHWVHEDASQRRYNVTSACFSTLTPPQSPFLPPSLMLRQWQALAKWLVSNNNVSVFVPNSPSHLLCCTAIERVYIIRRRIYSTYLSHHGDTERKGSPCVTSVAPLLGRDWWFVSKEQRALSYKTPKNRMFCGHY